MATTKQYALQLWQAQKVICHKLGFDPRTSDIAFRAVIISCCVMVGCVLRILFLKGTATDAEMQSVFSAARDADFPALNPSPPPINEDNLNPPDPDLGV